MTAAESTAWLDAINWDSDGLVAAVAQEAGTGKILTLAWMNREALTQTVKLGEAVYWSRSRGKLWHKGEKSGHTQKIARIFLDCDNDAIVLQVQQTGGIACHTGRQSCFYQQLKGGHWIVVDPVLKDPETIYGQDD